MKSSVEKIIGDRFFAQCNKIQNKIADRLDDHARILLSGAAFFNASGSVSRQEWRTFTQYQQFKYQLPGIQGLGFSLLIPAEELPQHILDVRREGFPSYQVSPEGERQVYSAIIYLEPFSSRNRRAFGYDMFSEPVRRDAMERARDTNAPALSGKVVLVQETGDEVQTGNLMYVPVYRKGMPILTVEQRRAAIYGWVYSPYRMRDLMQGIFGNRHEKENRPLLRIFDGDEASLQNLLYEDLPHGDAKFSWNESRSLQQIPIDFNGHRWIIHFAQAGGLYSSVDYLRVWLTLAGGTLFTLLTFALIRSFHNTSLEERRMMRLLRQSDKTLRRSEERLALALQIGNAGSWGYNINTGKFWTSAEGARIYGLPSACGGISREVIEACIPERERVHQALDALINEGQEYNLHYAINPPDGSPAKFITSTARLERDQQGNPREVLGFIQDITERNHAEKAHQELQNQLHQLQKIESMGRLAGGVAHDYNNMLSVIIGRTELAQMRIHKPESLHNDLDQILGAAMRSRDITQQLLAFARKQIISPRVLDLNETVEGMLTMLKQLLGENIDLVWQPKEGLWPVELDPSQMDQILANLCINARDAIADIGKINIETRMVTLDQAYCHDHTGFIPGDFVMLAVSDNGCGMDKETLDKIFEPFFTTKGLGEGTGLGLSMVYGVVKQHNGFINVYSEPDEGTTFKIYLPRYKGQIAEECEAVCGELLKGHGETVLVVEDETSILTLIEEMLSDFGYKVLAANSPSEALDLANAHLGEIHLLITDVVMPGMNGRVLAGRLLQKHPQLKCLYMSGYTANVIAHHGVLDKGIHFIQKPFSRIDFSVQIRTALGL
jgi:signal transduction histidine kinase/CHASE1-domain containing sensor protein/CheY-like chemotaxis protein